MWPRGKYTGRRIVGFRVALTLDVTHWRLLPRVTWNFGEPHARWLCLSVRAHLQYEAT